MNCLLPRERKLAQRLRKVWKALKRSWRRACVCLSPCLSVTPSLPASLALCVFLHLGLRGESGFHGNDTLCLCHDISLHHKLSMALICMRARMSAFVPPTSSVKYSLKHTACRCLCDLWVNTPIYKDFQSNKEKLGDRAFSFFLFLNACLLSFHIHKKCQNIYFNTCFLDETWSHALQKRCIVMHFSFMASSLNGWF